MGKLKQLSTPPPPEADLFIQTDHNGTVCIDLKIGDKTHSLAFVGEDGTLELLHVADEDKRDVEQFVRLDDRSFWKAEA